jgi:hypothetical protein
MKRCPTKDWLTTKEAASYPDVSVETMKESRKLVKGLPYYKRSDGIRYRTTDLVCYGRMVHLVMSRIQEKKDDKSARAKERARHSDQNESRVSL